MSTSAGGGAVSIAVEAGSISVSQEAPLTLCPAYRKALVLAYAERTEYPTETGGAETGGEGDANPKSKKPEEVEGDAHAFHSTLVQKSCYTTRGAKRKNCFLKYRHEILPEDLLKIQQAAASRRESLRKKEDYLENCEGGKRTNRKIRDG